MVRKARPFYYPGQNVRLDDGRRGHFQHYDRRGRSVVLLAGGQSVSFDPARVTKIITEGNAQQRARRARQARNKP